MKIRRIIENPTVWCVIRMVELCGFEEIWNFCNNLGKFSILCMIGLCSEDFHWLVEFQEYVER